MRPLCPRYHWFEIHDQTWFPDYFREKVQACLTLAWTMRVRPLQKCSPADLVAKTLLSVLPPGQAAEYTFVDFCAGAGGPTPTIEKVLNAQLKSDATTDPAPSAHFVLTDLHPHLEAWAAVAKKSDKLGYVSTPVDASDAPRDLLKDRQGGNKVFRLFFLAFHHFDDPLAATILRNSIETADGFAIFELQERTLLSMVMVTSLGLLLMLISPFYFWRSPGHLFFTYIIPIVPFVVTFDGYISSIRTRSADEILALLEPKNDPDPAATSHLTKQWKFGDGRVMHSDPIGYMSYFIGVKKDAQD